MYFQSSIYDSVDGMKAEQHTHLALKKNLFEGKNHSLWGGCLEVNLCTLSHNVRLLSRLVKEGGGGFFCPVIKSNGYGHGMIEVAQTLYQAGVKKLAVSSFEEALQLKKISKNVEIYIFGPYRKEQVSFVHSHNFIPVVSNWDNLNFLIARVLTNKKPIRFHLKFNTGMNRLGFHPHEVSQVVDVIKKHPLLKLEGLASHLSCGESLMIQNDLSQKAPQPIVIFKKLILYVQKKYPQQKLHTHLLNSAGWFALWSHGQLDPVLGFRPGISLYGIKPAIKCVDKKATKKYHTLSLQAVSCLKAFVVHSLNVATGESVSYEGQWVACRDSVIAVVAMGYADGVPFRLFPAEVLLRGQRVAIAGRICMNFFMIDVTDVLHKTFKEQGDIKQGEEVVIFGSQKKAVISLLEQAKKAGTICYDLLTQLNNRVNTHYVKD